MRHVPVLNAREPLAGDNILTALSVARECHMVQARDRVVLVSAALAPDACVAVAAGAGAGECTDEVLVRQRWRERHLSERDESTSHLRPLFSSSESGSSAKRSTPTQLSFRSEEGVQLELYVDPTWVRPLAVPSPSPDESSFTLLQRRSARSRWWRLGAPSASGARMALLADGDAGAAAAADAGGDAERGVHLRLASKTVSFSSSSEPGASLPERSHAGSGASAATASAAGAPLLPAGEPLHLAFTGECWSLLYRHDRELLMQVRVRELSSSFLPVPRIAGFRASVLWAYVVVAALVDSSGAHAARAEAAADRVPAGARLPRGHVRRRLQRCVRVRVRVR